MLLLLLPLLSSLLVLFWFLFLFLFCSYCCYCVVVVSVFCVGGGVNKTMLDSYVMQQQGSHRNSAFIPLDNQHGYMCEVCANGEVLARSRCV
jgi:hypothetical protein